MRLFRFRSSGRTAALAAVLLFVAHHVTAQSAPPKLTVAQWQADVRFLGDELPKRHRNAYHRMKREDFDAAVNALYAAVPKMSDDEIIVGLMKLVAMIHDGHTNMIPRPFLTSGIYPIKLYQFNDGVYVIKTAPAYADMLGGQVLRIGNASIDNAMTAVGPMVAADNEMGIRDLGPQMLSIPEALSGLKIINDKHSLDVVISKDGKERTFTLHPEGALQDIFTPPATWLDAAPAEDKRPLYQTHRSESFWFQYLPSEQLLYVKQDAVQNGADKTLADEYKRIFDFIDANPVDKLVIDIRNNGGGNNGLNSPIIVDLIRSKVDKRGHLFVITGRQTFSAAQNFTNQIEKWTEAIFVGEPTADHVNMYGDNRPFVLPNSGLTVRASTLWWQDLDPRDERKWKAPDIAADLSFKDYAAGRDPAFQAVLDYRHGSTLSEIISSANENNSLGDFAARYRAARTDPKSKYVTTESALNQLGYTLLAKKRLVDAVEVFRLNTEDHPNSANAFDSLGEALAAAGKTDEAVKAYEKAVTIDPTFQSSIDALRRLKHS